MWWIALIFPIVIILVFIIAIFISSAGDKRKDHKKDNDNNQTNVNETSTSEPHMFFMPANDRAGILGEQRLNYELRHLLKEDEYLLSNLLLPLKNGHKTEIDCVLITHKGIFCIEGKTWMGHIVGTDEDEYWYQEYDDRRRAPQSHQNPIKQNEGHCVALERTLHGEYTVDNVVIFVDLEDGEGIVSDRAFTINDFIDYYRDYDEDELDSFETEGIYQTLLPYVATKEELRKHKDEVRKLHNN